MKRIIIIEDDNYPYQEVESFKAYSNPCEHCPNNPTNNLYASGVCDCALPYMNNIRY